MAALALPSRFTARANPEPPTTLCSCTSVTISQFSMKTHFIPWRFNCFTLLWQAGRPICLYLQTGVQKGSWWCTCTKTFPSMKTNRNIIAERKISIYHFDVSNYCLCNVCQLHLTWRCNTIPQQISAASSFKLLHINLFFWGWSKHEFIKRFQEK